MRKLLIFLLSAFACAQQPQIAITPQAIQNLNARWVQGVGIGFAPTKGSGLTLNIGPGTCFDASLTRHAYAGGTITVTNAATNYVSLASADCSFNQSTSAYTAGNQRLYSVVASGGVITSYNDDRTWFVPFAPLAVVNTRRTCMIVVGADNGAALADADLGPQLNQCFVAYAATVVEIEVMADAGTPNVIVQRSHLGTPTALLSGALATASAGAVACSNTGGATGLDGTTTCTNTLQNTSVAAGDWIGLTSGTAGGTAKRMTVAITMTVN